MGGSGSGAGTLQPEALCQQGDIWSHGWIGKAAEQECTSVSHGSHPQLRFSPAKWKKWMTWRRKAYATNGGSVNGNNLQFSELLLFSNCRDFQSLVILYQNFECFSCFFLFARRFVHIWGNRQMFLSFGSCSNKVTYWGFVNCNMRLINQSWSASDYGACSNSSDFLS